MEPPPSVPMPSSEPPPAISAASPPLEPPEVRAGSNALSVRPCGTDSVSYDHMYSGTVVFASTTAPARLTRSTTVASASGTFPSRAADPVRHGSPATASESLMLIGSPSSGPSSPPARLRSASAASRSTCSSSTAATALSARIDRVQQRQLVPGQLDGGDLARAQPAQPLAGTGMRRAHRRRT